MKAFLLCAALLAALAAGGGRPTTRVVQLLEDLQRSVEEEARAEEKLYEKFVCWAETVINTKTNSNDAAAKRISELKTFIDNAKGSVFTSEGADLQKQLDELERDISVAKANREQEKSEYDAAKTEMTEALTALASAISTMKGATKDHTDGVFEQTSSRIQMARVVELGDRVLSKGDALFLRRTFSHDVPNPDWKKLNRKATFKMNYKARSFDIIVVLENVQTALKENKAVAKDKEDAAVKMFEKTITEGGKDDEVKAIAKRMVEADVETSERDKQTTEAQEEKDLLAKQVKADSAFIKQTEQSLKDKKVNFKERKTKRVEEIAAIGEAISILRGDDSRDVFKKSFESQAYGFLQVSSKGDVNHTVHIDVVIKAIDKMIAHLQEDKQTRLAEKEEAEKSRRVETNKVIVDSRFVDELTGKIERLSAEIDECNARIEEQNSTLLETNKEFNAAAQIREDESAAFVKDVDDDKRAVKLVEDATKVLSTFYTPSPSFLESSEPGEAPPPPPSTWDAPYEGRKKEGRGVIAILEMISEDMEKDISTANDNEEKNKKDFADMKGKVKKIKIALEDEMNTVKTKRNNLKSDRADFIKERQKKAKELASAVPDVNVASDDAKVINFDALNTNTNIEIKGLQNARHILKDATFSG